MKVCKNAKAHVASCNVKKKKINGQGGKKTAIVGFNMSQKLDCLINILILIQHGFTAICKGYSGFPRHRKLALQTVTQKAIQAICQLWPLCFSLSCGMSIVNLRPYVKIAGFSIP